MKHRRLKKSVKRVLKAAMIFMVSVLMIFGNCFMTTDAEENSSGGGTPSSEPAEGTGSPVTETSDPSASETTAEPEQSPVVTNNTVQEATPAATAESAPSTSSDPVVSIKAQPTEQNKAAGTNASATTPDNSLAKKVPLPPENNGSEMEETNQFAVSCEGLDQLHKNEDGVIEYNLIQDTAQTFKITFPKELFKGTDLTLDIHLPIGFVFESNTFSSLNAQPEIKNASPQESYTAAHIVVDGKLQDQYLTSVTTRYMPLSVNQCDNIIKNGFKVGTVSFTVRQNNSIVAEDNHYKLIPEQFQVNDNTVTVENHSVITPTIHYFADIGAGYGGTAKNNVFKMTIPTFDYSGNENAGLLKVTEIRVYTPDNRKIYLNKLVQSFESGKTLPLDTMVSLDPKEYTDDNGNIYYRIIPYGKGLYNTQGNGNITYQIAFDWNIKEGEELEEDKTYQAPDIEIYYETPTNRQGVFKRPGVEIKTLPIDHIDNFYAVANNSYKGTGKEVSQGAVYENEYFTTLYNHSSVETDDNNNPIREKRSVKGEVKEVYTFPDTVNVTSWQAEQFYYFHERCKVKNIKATIVDAQGNETEKTYEVNKLAHPSRDSSANDCRVDFTGDLTEGSHIKSVEVNWNDLYSWNDSGYYGGRSEFTYQVSDTAEGQYQIQSNVTCADSEHRFDTDTQTDYFWINVKDKKCPYLVISGALENGGYGEGYGGMERYPVDLDDSEVPSTSYIAAIGQSGGAYRTYYENPVITLGITTQNIKISNPLNFLAGSMIMTKNLSGWDINYSVYHSDTKTNEDKTYHVQNLTGDTPLTREMLELKDDDYITSFKLQYKGICNFSEISKEKRSDNETIKSFDYAYFLKKINVKTISHDQDGNRIETTPGKRSSVTITATLSHSGSCDRQTHATGEKAPADRWRNELSVLSNYKYEISGPNFSGSTSESVIHQGAVAHLNVNFSLHSVPVHNGPQDFFYGTDLTTNHNICNIPYDVPESIYIELTDPQFSVDTADKTFQDSLKKHGLTTNDLEIVSVGNKRFLKISTGSKTGNWKEIDKTYDSDKKTRSSVSGWGGGRNLDSSFTIALKAWNGARVGNHSPFGKVYYDVSDLITKYTGGTPESRYSTITFNGAVPDTEGLIGDGDSTTSRLWEGDLSNLSINVTRNVVTNVEILPGKNQIFDQSHLTTFLGEDREKLSSSVTITVPKLQVDNYSVILHIPQKDEEITRTYQDTNASYKTENVVTPYGMHLISQANTANSSLPEGTNLTYSYSIDGQTYVSAEQVNDWNSIKYVKAVIDKVQLAEGSDYPSVEIQLPLKADEKDQVGNETAYITAKASYSDNGDAENVTVASAGFQYTDYQVTGMVWRDKNKDGIYATDENGIKGITLQINNGDKPIDQVKTDSDGAYTLRTYTNVANQNVTVNFSDDSDDYKLTKKVSQNYTDRNDDSDFDQDSKKVTLNQLTSAKTENLNCGLIYIPSLTVKKENIETKDPIGQVSFQLKKGGNPVKVNDDTEGKFTIYDKDKEKGFRIKDIEDGDYTLTETETPSGYKSLENNIGFTVKDGIVSSVGNSKYVSLSEDKKVLTVYNEPGIRLPDTGGRGTVIFYLCGGILIIGAALLLIRKRKA